MLSYIQVLHKKAEFFPGATLGPQRSTSGPPVEPQSVSEAYESFVYGGQGYKDKYKDEWKQGFKEGWQDSSYRTARNLINMPYNFAKVPGFIFSDLPGYGLDALSWGYNKLTGKQDVDDQPNFLHRLANSYYNGVDYLNPTTHTDFFDPQYLTEDQLLPTDITDAIAETLLGTAGTAVARPAAAAAKAGQGLKGVLSVAKSPKVITAAKKALPWDILGGGLYVGSVAAANADEPFYDEAETGSSGTPLMPWRQSHGEYTADPDTLMDIEDRLKAFNAIAETGYDTDQLEAIAEGKTNVGVPAASPVLREQSAAIRDVLLDDYWSEMLGVPVSGTPEQTALEGENSDSASSNSGGATVGSGATTNPGGSRSTPQRTYKDVLPYLAAGGAGLAGYLGTNLLTRNSKWLKRHRLIKRLVNLAGAGAMGYAAWRLANGDKTGS